MALATVLQFAQQAVASAIQRGDSVLDATCGNGHDCLFLANCVGSSGTVYAFDRQQQALDISQALLRQHGLASAVNFIHANHQDLDKYIEGELAAAMFNFGYLPGGDKSITTEAGSSLIAIEKVIGKLKTGGIMSLLLYAGHPAGKIEAAAIKDYLAAYPQQQLQVLRYQFHNRPSHAPHLLLCARL